MRTNYQYLYLPWVCPACDCTTLIDPEEPEYYCSDECETRAAQAVSVMLAPSSEASRYLVKHLRYFYKDRHEYQGSGVRGYLADDWAKAIANDLSKMIKVKPVYKSPEVTVEFWHEIYYGGQA